MSEFTRDDVLRHLKMAGDARRRARAIEAESMVRAPTDEDLLRGNSAQLEAWDLIRWHEDMAKLIADLLPPEGA